MAFHYVLLLLLTSQLWQCQGVHDGAGTVGPVDSCSDVLLDVQERLRLEFLDTTRIEVSIKALLDCSKIALGPTAQGDDDAAKSLPTFPTVKLQHASPQAIGTLASLLQYMHPNQARLQALAPSVHGSHSRFTWELRELAAQLGDPESQGEHAVALMYGLTPPPLNSPDEFGPLASPQIAPAMVNLYFAAAGNNSFANAALGMKHLQGTGVPESCPSAALYYRNAAKDVIELATQQVNLPEVTMVRLSTLHLATPPQEDLEVLQFYQNSADMGNTESARLVGHLLNRRGSPTSRAEAVDYFQRAADGGDTDAMAQLGHMYAAGTQVRQDNETAIKWFMKAVEAPANKDRSASGLLGLGYMYMMGHGVERDHTRAIKLLAASADKKNPEAQYHLGVMMLNGWGMQSSKPDRALKLFSQAATNGHILAVYNIAMLHLSGGNRVIDCQKGVRELARVANSGPNMRYMALAWDNYLNARYDAALYHYLFAAELGLEVARSNAAWLLDQGYITPNKYTAQLSLRLHASSSNQFSSLEAHLAIGDAYYYGLGVPRDAAVAVTQYRLACPPTPQMTKPSMQAYAQAAFNMGYMHQFGIGVLPDLTLAKRYYDQSMQRMHEARWAVRLAVLSITVHKYWDSFAIRFPSIAASLLGPSQRALNWLSHNLLVLVNPVYAYHNGDVPDLKFLTIERDPTSAEAPAGDGDASQAHVESSPELASHVEKDSRYGGLQQPVDKSKQGDETGWHVYQHTAEASVILLLFICVAALLVLRSRIRGTPAADSSQEDIPRAEVSFADDGGMSEGPSIPADDAVSVQEPARTSTSVHESDGFDSADADACVGDGMDPSGCSSRRIDGTGVDESIGWRDACEGRREADGSLCESPDPDTSEGCNESGVSCETEGGVESDTQRRVMLEAVLRRRLLDDSGTGSMM